MKDGTGLNGWLVKNNGSDRSKLIIYFGGNGDELSYMIEAFDGLDDWSVALINYRGYGQSEGQPGEGNLFSDALESYDYFSSRKDIDNAKIVVMGRSLGTGVATYVAGKRNPAAVILVSPYDSMVSVAQRHYPFLPAELMLRHRFDSISRAPSIKAPLLMLFAPEDTVIPAELSRKLAANWGGAVTVSEIKNADHNTICAKEPFWASVKGFLKSIE